MVTAGGPLNCRPGQGDEYFTTGMAEERAKNVPQIS